MLSLYCQLFSLSLWTLSDRDSLGEGAGKNGK